MSACRVDTSPGLSRSGRGGPDPSVLAGLGILRGTEALLPARAVLALGWPELERALPDGGLPRGVVELAAMPRLQGRARGAAGAEQGGATSIAIAAVRSVHLSDEHAWCVWITPRTAEERVLHAPALVQAGVDLERLLVVRPPPEALARTVVKAASSGAFAVVVIDALLGRDFGPVRVASRRGGGAAADGGALVVRKLALAAEESGTASLVLTSALAPRPVPWPVAMRVELERRPDALSLRVTKDRRGRQGAAAVVRLLEPSGAMLARAG